jgi:hypothetical protein
MLRKKSTEAFQACTWIPLSTFALMKQEAASRGQNTSQYIGELITNDLRDNEVTLKIV